MTELAVLEHQLPSLHLPDIDRGDVLRSLQGVTMPEISLERLENLPPDIRDTVRKFELPAWLAMLDLSGSRARAARAARIRRQTLWLGGLGGLIVLGLGALAILGNESIRARLWQLLAELRTKVTAMRSGSTEWTDSMRDEPVAFDAAATAPLDASRDPYRIADDRADYPSGLGSNNDDTPVLQEVAATA